MTRVVAGTLGGRRLDVPKGRAVRPTSDRVREALFSTLGDRVVGAKVLDLFAGTGALGIEALSRGAAHATFVERDPAVARVLRANLEALGLIADVRVVTAARYVDEVATDADAPVFDVVLCDPPYHGSATDVVVLLDSLVRGGHVAPDALMAIERSRHGDAFVLPNDILAVTDVRTYGDTVLYYVRSGAADEQEGGPDA
ncbi:MAG TPA: 16S rRNA (guanine(966)-N(2))-methyltransferase RsmD [Euzebyales bacterium]|nr:16S rRNA (guanine(966)-N(2))-methyltransferase RsmD [Euzebyales bacterium]